MNLFLILFVSMVSFAENESVCLDIEKINEHEVQYGISKEQQVIFSIDPIDENTPFELHFENNSLRCIFNEDLSKYKLKIEDEQSVCSSINQINENEEEFKIPPQDQIVHLMEADGGFFSQLELSSGKIRCVKGMDGFWSLHLSKD